METFIVSQRVPDLSAIIRDTLNRATTPALRDYLESILALPLEEQERWFLSDEGAEELTRDHSVDRAVLVEIPWIIITICAVVVTVVSVWNSAKKQWEKKEVKKTECKQKKVQKKK